VSEPRANGLYWVRDKGRDGSWAGWRVDLYHQGWWYTHGSDEAYRESSTGAPDKVGEMLANPPPE
jgi:hypothetical protein